MTPRAGAETSPAGRTTTGLVLPRACVIPPVSSRPSQLLVQQAFDTPFKVLSQEVLMPPEGWGQPTIAQPWASHPRLSSPGQGSKALQGHLGQLSLPVLHSGSAEARPGLWGPGGPVQDRDIPTHSHFCCPAELLQPGSKLLQGGHSRWWRVDHVSKRCQPWSHR